VNTGPVATGQVSEVRSQRESISSDAVAPGQTLVITASASAEGLFGAGTDVEIAEGAVAPCEPVQASGDEAAAARQGSSGGR